MGNESFPAPDAKDIVSHQTPEEARPLDGQITPPAVNPGSMWEAPENGGRLGESPTTTERALGASTLQGAKATMTEDERAAMADVVADTNRSGVYDAAVNHFTQRSAERAESDEAQRNRPLQPGAITEVPRDSTTTTTAPPETTEPPRTTTTTPRTTTAQPSTANMIGGEAKPVPKGEEPLTS